MRSEVLHSVSPSPRPAALHRAGGQDDARPASLPEWIAAGDSLRTHGRIEEALSAYEQARLLVPGHALPFTRDACLRLEGLLGSAAAPAPAPAPAPVPAPAPAPTAHTATAAPSGARVQMSNLGANGRYGNQLLQYAFLRLYAQRHGLIAEAPEWIGRHVFGFADPLPSRARPVINETSHDLFAALRGEVAVAPRDCDLNGYFCADTSLWGPMAGDFRRLFAAAVPQIQRRLDSALARVHARGRNLVAIHLRRGDFGYGRFWIAPAGWYLDWLRRLWRDISAPVLYIATDDPRTAEAFGEFQPVLSRDLEVGPDPLPLLLDHFLLAQASHLAISNSSFSFTAAMLNSNLQVAVRPDPDSRRLVAFDPWASPVLLDAAPVRPWRSVTDRVSTGVMGADQCVLHYGSHCAGWTHEVRAHFPALRVHELERGESLDDWRAAHAVDVIHHLSLGDEVDFEVFAASARQSLASASIGMLHLGSVRADRDQLDELLQHCGFSTHAVHANGAVRLAIASPRATAHIVAAGGGPRSDAVFADRPALGNVQPGELPALLIVSMFTLSHRALAERLADSLSTFGVPFALYEVSTVHDSISPRGTPDSSCTKANFVRCMLDRYGIPVLYVDCDCVLRSEPRLLRNLVGSGCEFAIYNWLADPYTDGFAPVAMTGPDGRVITPVNRFYRYAVGIDAFAPTQLICSGATQFYANTTAARGLLDTWSAVIAENPGVPDDPCLDVAFNLRTPTAQLPRYSWLDKAYARYLYWIYARPVIDHPQMPAGPRQQTAAAREFSRRPRYRTEIAEVRNEPRLLPRDCIIDTQERRLLRLIAPTPGDARVQAADAGPLLHELFLDQ